MTETKRETTEPFIRWDQPRSGMWRAHESDLPVTIIGEYEQRPEDDIKYLVSDSSLMGIPANEVEFAPEVSSWSAVLEVGITAAKILLKTRKS